MSTQTHCQICGRLIQAKKGLIAHHGYTRQGGWQSASCFGARWAPYEVSNKAIPHAIEKASEYIEAAEHFIVEQMANPPETIEYLKPTGRTYETKKIVLPRPEGFDPTNNFSPLPYAEKFRSRINERNRGIKMAQEDLKYLEDRFNSWKEVEA